ncbi:MAG: SNARE associated Golgi protein [Candidatus Izimaplasma bacterium HR2]|nr:MAG: SNARE associated Golgi protein [Candidatus Izimaplasma bacterium HR2]
MNVLLTSEVSGFFSFLNPIIDLLQDLGHTGLALYTFFEVVLIIPPIEVIYYPLILLDVDNWYLYLLNVIFFNVIASAFGYYVGKKIGYPVLRYFASEDILEKAHKLFENWGILAVAIGAFVPFIPYTIVVFLGGITKMDFKKFMIAGFLGRVPRYIIGGYLVAFVVQGIDSAELNEYMLIVSIVGMLLFIIYYIMQGLYNLYKRQRAN